MKIFEILDTKIVGVDCGRGKDWGIVCYEQGIKEKLVKYNQSILHYKLLYIFLNEYKTVDFLIKEK